MVRRWSRWRTAVLLAGSLQALATPLAYGQGSATGAVAGAVADPAGEPLANVLIVLQDERSGFLRSLYSDRAGAFRFGLLPPGSYDLSVEKLGYQPLRLEGLRIRPGADVRVQPRLNVAGAGPVQAMVERHADRLSSGAGAGGVEWTPAWAAAGLPHGRGEIGDLARLSTRAGQGAGLDGLAPWHTVLAIDGVPFRPAAHPLLRSAGVTSMAIGVAGIESAEFVTDGRDVEWGGAAGGWIGVHTRRGSPTLEVEGRGDWAGTPLPGPSFSNGLSYHDAFLGAAVRSPVLGESARVSAGVQVRRLETPVSPAWGDSPDALTLSELGESFPVDFASYRRARVTPANVIAGYARFDWQITDRHQFSAWTHTGWQTQLTGSEPRLRSVQGVAGADVLAAASIRSALAGSAHNEARLAVTTSSRRTAEPADVGPTWIASDGLSLGGVRTAAEGRELRLMLSDAVHLMFGRHALKLGAGLNVLSQRYEYRHGSDGEVYFGGIDEMLAQRGLIVRVDGAAPSTHWNTVVPELFAQDRWNLGGGLEALVGVRADYLALPGSNVARDVEWARLSGLANDSVADPGWRGEARFGLTLDVQQDGRWLLHAGGGVQGGEIDPLLLSEWQTDDGSGSVRRELGALAWPSDPAAGGSFRRVTVLSPDFTPPRTVRGSGGVAHRLDGAVELEVTGAVRRTVNLPRRVDLNLLPQPAMRDQYGRAVFGTLVQQGSLLAAEPGTGRRFAEYDEAAGVSADGWSEYVGVSVGVERAAATGTAFMLRYTFSRTRDNWFAGSEGGWTAAAPRGFDGSREWVEGVSDFDSPHRAVAAIAVPLAAGLRASIVYRVESGMPFTPGFRRGVDANGDGSAANDPAFVDAAVTGMEQLISRWNCLEASRDRFAARNSCRGAATQTLDLGLSAEFLRFGGGRAAVTAEAFNILETARDVPDAALFLVDPNRTLEVDDGTRTVSVPLIPNPNFGESVIRPAAGRSFRFGLLVKW